jgi:uncharacterized protein (TIGR03067 family)
MRRSVCAAVLYAVAGLALVPAATGADEPKRLTNDELIKMVNRFGYDVKVLDKTFTQVAIDREGWRSVVRLSLSTDGTVVWIDAWLLTPRFPDAVPAETWRKLLAKNEAIHPVMFSMNAKSKRLYLMHSLPNADLTPALLREHISLLDKTIEETKDLWKLANFVPPVSADGMKQLGSLSGTWKVVEMNDVGKEISAEEAAKYAYKFDKDKFELTKDGKSIRKGQLVAATTDGTKQLDRYDTGTVVHGIYKLDGDTLTWCYSSSARPGSFAGNAKTSTSLFVMKREK